MGEYISPFLYAYFYAAFMFLILVIKSIPIGGEGLLKPESVRVGMSKTLLLALFFIIFFATRPISTSLHMGDTWGYARRYELYADAQFPIAMNWSEKDSIWNYVYRNMSALGFSVVDWFFLVAAIYVLCNVWGIKRIFPKHIYLAFLFYSTFFMFYQCGMNGIRNGVAISIIFLAIALYYHPKPVNYILVAVLMGVGLKIHTSVYITICAFLASVFLIKKTNWAISIWLIAIGVSLLIGNSLGEYASSITDDDRALRYLNAGSNSRMMEQFSRTGFRWDFLLFSAFPIAIGWYVTVKRRIKDKYYQILLNTYIIANAVWVIFIYAAFTNRFAMLSWCLYPYVLCYPFLKMDVWLRPKQTRYTSMSLWMMFAFMLFMTIKTH